MSKETIIALHAEHQGRWKNREEIAERMITLIGQLYREKNIVVSVYGRSLINRSVIQILKTHRRTRMLDVELSVVHTFPILEALMKVENIGSAAFLHYSKKKVKDIIAGFVINCVGYGKEFTYKK